MMRYVAIGAVAGFGLTVLLLATAGRHEPEAPTPVPGAPIVVPRTLDTRGVRPVQMKLRESHPFATERFVQQAQEAAADAGP